MTTLFTPDHEWLRIEGDVATIGVTDYAQSQLGDVVFVELPKVGRQLKKAEAAAVVESVKAASDVYAPISGEVLEVNDAVAAEPALVNSDAGGKAWFFKLKIADKQATRRPDGRGRLQGAHGVMNAPRHDRSSRASARLALRKDRRGSRRRSPRMTVNKTDPLGMTTAKLPEPATNFARRHIGPSPRDIDAMLETVGAKSLAALMSETLPSSIRQQEPLDLGEPLSETEALAHMAKLAAQNQVFTSLIGQGYSGTILPPVIQRNILENPAWYTAYTPYQPEISQGRLEALFNFQTMICDLTGLDVANASLLDEATAAAEAMALAERVGAGKIENIFRRPRRASADAGGAAHPRRAAGLEPDCRRSPQPISTAPRCAARCCNIRAPPARCATCGRAIAAVRAKGGARDRRRRSAGADAARLAGRTRRRYRDRLGAAFWRADGIWRPARGLYGGARCAEAIAARPHRRAVDRFARANLPIAWRCRPASSTSAARRRPRTSAPRRCCWR